MLKYIKEFLSESGSASIMRLAFILLILNGIGLAWASVLACFINAILEIKGYKAKIVYDYFAIISLLFTTATALKLTQKALEKRKEQDKKDSNINNL